MDSQNSNRGNSELKANAHILKRVPLETQIYIFKTLEIIDIYYAHKIEL